MSNMNPKISWPGWETVKLIGRGNFGAVYEIQREMFGEAEKAALKVISIPQNDSDIEELYNDGYDDESITSTFQSHLKSIVMEYFLMRKMNGCSNVVNCDDIRYVPHEDGIGWDVYIKMELLTSLAKVLPETVSDELVMNIAYDICTALELCAKHDVVHRDIKPQNIFLSPNGDYKLGDFGIAKTVEKTMGGTKIGTYKYMAPEVYYCKPYGARADIYSLGLVLYWILNDRRMPFLPLPPVKLTATMEAEARERRFSGEQIPMPAHGSAELKRIVLKACAYDPEDRYRTAKDMKNDLRALMFGISMSASTVHISNAHQPEKEQSSPAVDESSNRTMPEQMPKKEDIKKTPTVNQNSSQVQMDVQKDLDWLHKEMDRQENTAKTKQADGLHGDPRVKGRSLSPKESEAPHKKLSLGGTEMSWSDLVDIFGKI